MNVLGISVNKKDFLQVNILNSIDKLLKLNDVLVFIYI